MEAAVPWRDVSARLRPFVASRVAASDVDDVLQDVLMRMHRGIATLADEQRFSAWMFSIARNAIAEHGRRRARHPLAADDDLPEVQVARDADDDDDDDREASRTLAGCVSMFVGALPSPYREAITLVELEGLTMREAADMVGISESGMKSRVQRGRARLRDLFERCCEIELDARGKVTDYTRRAPGCGC